MRYFIALVIFLVLIQSVFGAVIQGRIYDIELNLLTDVIIEISPDRQVYVSQDGDYSFLVDEGAYLLQARKKPDLQIEEQITVKQNLNYTLDLILLPDLTEETYLLKETGVTLDNEEAESALNWIILIPSTFIILALLFFIIKLFLSKQTEIISPDKLEQDIIEFIKKQDSRTTQKEIRRNIPYSEAKISLVIAQLEQEGKIRKIKKGRGNIIVLN